jgi:hypothetical protein
MAFFVYHEASATGKCRQIGKWARGDARATPQKTTNGPKKLVRK